MDLGGGRFTGCFGISDATAVTVRGDRLKSRSTRLPRHRPDRTLAFVGGRHADSVGVYLRSKSVVLVRATPPDQDREPELPRASACPSAPGERTQHALLGVATPT